MYGALPYMYKNQNYVNVAKNFYQQHGYAKKEISSHLRCINFRKRVRRIKLNINDIIYQYRSQDCKHQGNYYTPFSKYTPSSLGIHRKHECLYKNPCFDDIRKREMLKYEVKKQDIEFLLSTASKAADTWSIRGKVFYTQGGGRQYFNKNDKKNIMKV